MVRISLEAKVEIIEASKKPGFNRKDVEDKYGISRTTVATILKDQVKLLKKAMESGFISKNTKSMDSGSMSKNTKAMDSFMSKNTKSLEKVSLGVDRKKLEILCSKYIGMVRKKFQNSSLF